MQESNGDYYPIDMLKIQPMTDVADFLDGIEFDGGKSKEHVLKN